MGPCAKTMILLLLLVYFDPLIGKVKGLEYGATSANYVTKGMAQVNMRKLVLEVDTQKDYNPYNPIPNPKHEPPPRGKSGVSSGGAT